MKFKEDYMQAQLTETPPLLQEMALSFESTCKSVSGIEPLVTRVSDAVQGDSGVHEAKRAFDVRDEFEGKNLFTAEHVKSIVDQMNAEYPRTDGKQTCIHHSFQGMPFHFHVQMAADMKAYPAKPKDQTWISSILRLLSSALSSLLALLSPAKN